LIPHFPSSRAFHATNKMSDEIVHPTIQGLLLNPVSFCVHTPPNYGNFYSNCPSMTMMMAGGARR
jgi:hypothetical protein